MVVDDDKANCFALNKLLKHLGYKSDEAYFGKVALKILLESGNKDCGCKYDLVFLDINMPKFNGFQTIV